MNGNENTVTTETETNTAPVVAAETKPVKTKKTKKAKTVKAKTERPILNKENTKVLNTIVKNPEISATGIRKKLRWGFTPTRSLSFLRDGKFVLVSKDKGYTVSAKGTAALAGAVKPSKRTAKPIVAAEGIAAADLAPANEPAPAMEPAAV